MSWPVTLTKLLFQVRGGETRKFQRSVRSEAEDVCRAPQPCELVRCVRLSVITGVEISAARVCQGITRYVSGPGQSSLLRYLPNLRQPV